MMSSLMPSEKYSCSASPLMLTKGRTAIAGRSEDGEAGRGRSQPFAADRPPPAPRRGQRLHIADESDALARDGSDQPLLLAAVADRPARSVDTAGKRRIRHDPAAPDRGEQIVLADDTLAILHEIDEQIEDLRLDGNRRYRRGVIRAGRCQAYDPKKETAKQPSGETRPLRELLDQKSSASRAKIKLSAMSFARGAGISGPARGNTTGGCPRSAAARPPPCKGRLQAKPAFLSD